MLRRDSLALALSLVLAGCPPEPNASRDGGTACTTESQCNPPGVSCGQISLCVAGYCSESRIVRVCAEAGSSVEAGGGDDCLGYQDCNPPDACGLVVSCVNFRCDRAGPPLEIPCLDAGAPTD